MEIKEELTRLEEAGYFFLIGKKYVVKYSEEEIRLVTIDGIITAGGKTYVKIRSCDSRLIPIGNIIFPTYTFEDERKEKYNSTGDWIPAVFATIFAAWVITYIVEVWQKYF